jgi:hypothetical protein
MVAVLIKDSEGPGSYESANPLQEGNVNINIPKEVSFTLSHFSINGNVQLTAKLAHLKNNRV